MYVVCSLIFCLIWCWSTCQMILVSVVFEICGLVGNFAFLKTAVNSLWILYRLLCSYCVSVYVCKVWNWCSSKCGSELRVWCSKLCSVEDTYVMSGDDICWCVVFCISVGVSMLSVIRVDNVKGQCTSVIISV